MFFFDSLFIEAFDNHPLFGELIISFSPDGFNDLEDHLCLLG